MSKWNNLINKYNPEDTDLCDLLDEAEKIGRADAVDELLKAIADNSYKIVEDYTVGEFARVCIWEDDLQKISEQLKSQN